MEALYDIQAKKDPLEWWWNHGDEAPELQSDCSHNSATTVARAVLILLPWFDSHSDQCLVEDRKLVDKDGGRRTEVETATASHALNNSNGSDSTERCGVSMAVGALKTKEDIGDRHEADGRWRKTKGEDSVYEG
ncbi:hypothetical protein SUGI_1051050 [Cryptomeria japonica]|nr:hypothetical protein SUGI_1051050 [Cryptomeria japonica]